MSILYEFSNDLRTRNVQFPWVDGLDTLKAGTPLDINGAIVNDDTAVGIVAEDVPRNWGRLISRDGNFYANAQVIVAGYIDEAAAESSCGLEYTEALKGALSDIHFIEGEIGSGGGGGGYLNVLCTFQNTKNGEIVNEQTVSEDYATIESAVNNRTPVFVYYSSLDDDGIAMFTAPYGVLVRAYDADDAPLTVTKQFVEYDHETHSGTMEVTSILIYFNPQTNKTEYFRTEGLTAELTES